MQLVTPSVVATAVRTDTISWITSLQVSFFIIIIDLSPRSPLLGECLATLVAYGLKVSNNELSKWLERIFFKVKQLDPSDSPREGRDISRRYLSVYNSFPLEVSVPRERGKRRGCKDHWRLGWVFFFRDVFEIRSRCALIFSEPLVQRYKEKQ